MARIYRQSSKENRFTQRKRQKSAKEVILIYLLTDAQSKE